MVARYVLAGLVVAFAILGSKGAFAEEVDLGDVSLEDLLNVKTSVATKKATSARSTPGILSIITEEDIRAMGARDLIDVLRLVPSLTFAYDVQGVVGIGVRGLWAYEGKYLLIVDGVEMNEVQFATTHFGNEFPVSHIKRIEIIRGPGSVIYGGFAELAVINITTKNGADLGGAQANVTFGQMKNAEGRKNFSLAYGKNTGDWDYSASGFIGRAKRGDGEYSGTDGTDSGSFDFKDADNLMPKMLNVGVSRGDWNLRLIHEDYKLTTRTMYNFTGIDVDIPNRFRSYNLLTNYTFNAGPSLKIVPQVQYSYQIPWEQTTPEAVSEGTLYNIHSQRVKAGITASYDVNSRLNLLAGLETVFDHHAWVKDPRNVHYNSKAFLGQALYDTDFGNFVVGARYEDPGFTESSFVPRLGYTRSTKDWHTKLLYAQAFRTPVLQNFETYGGNRGAVLPEKTETLEAEFGHAISSATYLTANVFHTVIKDPIVYYNNGTSDVYDNFHEVGTRGLELDYRLRPRWGQFQLAYSYYQVIHNNVEIYRVAGEEDVLVGIPQHRGVLNGWFNLGGLRLNPGLVYLGKKYGSEYNRNTNLQELRSSSEKLLVNFFVSKKDLGLKGLEAGAGVFNIMNEDVRYYQPYISSAPHSPVPGPSREVVAKIEYKHTF